MTIRLFALAIALSLTPMPIVVASEGPPEEPGLPRACERSGNEKPCRKVIPDTIVLPGDEVVYRGNWKAVGTVIVQGTATIVDANITFEPTSAGFIAEAGGTINVWDSSLIEVGNSTFAIDAGLGSTLTFNGSTVLGGDGVKVATSDVALFGNVLADIPLALQLTGVTATIHDNTFVNNTIAVNQTGGVPTLESNVFDGGEICVKDWRTDPNILNNTFRRCHIGIYHEESDSVFRGNVMDDEVSPPGAGMWILNGHSPVIEDNVIRNYGTGIKITNARAFVRNNTIEGNYGAGILVEQNSGPMDIQGNVVRLNGGEGIRLVGAADVPVFDNVVEDNGGDGIALHDSAAASLERNTARGNGGAGIALYASPDAALADNLAEGNDGTGILVAAGSVRAALAGNDALGNAAHGIRVAADGASVSGGSASGNGDHGLFLDHALEIVVADLTANGNGLDGVLIGASQATLHGVNASLNERNGFTYDPMGPLELLGTTPMTSVRALDNGAAGLHNVDGNATSVRSAWWEGNDVAGVQNDDVVSLIDARECYWGSATGPTHALNPLGTGDSAVGGVLYVPFLTEPPEG